MEPAHNSKSRAKPGKCTSSKTEATGFGEFHPLMFTDPPVFKPHSSDPWPVAFFKDALLSALNATPLDLTPLKNANQSKVSNALMASIPPEVLAGPPCVDATQQILDAFSELSDPVHPK